MRHQLKGFYLDTICKSPFSNFKTFKTSSLFITVRIATLSKHSNFCLINHLAPCSCEGLLAEQDMNSGNVESVHVHTSEFYMLLFLPTMGNRYPFCDCHAGNKTIGSIRSGSHWEPNRSNVNTALCKILLNWPFGKFLNFFADNTIGHQHSAKQKLMHQKWVKSNF